MSLKVAFQMDPILEVDINADTSFRLAEEAQLRGHELFFYTPNALMWREGRLTARGHKMTVHRDPAQPAHLEALAEIDLSAVDVIWLRQDPPFDMGYITTTHLLDHVHPDTLVVNDPTWVRNSPEKLLCLNFPELIPPTVITRDLAMLQEVRAEWGDVIVKPLYGNGGAGVFRLKAGDGNMASLHELFTQMNNEPLILQKFLPEVSGGDKRIILVEGEAVGAINRVPPEGETRSNLHVGGRAEPVTLTERDKEICAAIGPTLRERGQVFVGIDVIGQYLTEINVTSPTGLQELERFEGRNIAADVWAAIEAKC